jgi:hypothetical protein
MELYNHTLVPSAVAIKAIDGYFTSFADEK